MGTTNRIRIGLRLAGATTIVFVSASTRRQIGAPIEPGNSFVDAIDFSPDGKLVATAGNYGAWLWKTAAQTSVGARMAPGLADSYAALFTPNGKVLVTTDTDGTIRFWSVATQHQVRTAIAPAGHPEFLQAALSPNGEILATTRFDGPAQLWPLNLKHA
jgi:WD40 repeat protein